MVLVTHCSCLHLSLILLSFFQSGAYIIIIKSASSTVATLNSNCTLIVLLFLLIVMLLSILSKDQVVQKDKPVGVLPTKSTCTPEITKTMT